jgi:hypothetical protein
MAQARILRKKRHSSENYCRCHLGVSQPDQLPLGNKAIFITPFPSFARFIRHYGLALRAIKQAIACWDITAALCGFVYCIHITGNNYDDLDDNGDVEESSPPLHTLTLFLQCIVAYRPVAKRWLYKQRPFLGNGSVNTFSLLCRRFLIMQQLDYNNGNGMFLHGPCRNVILKTIGEAKSVLYRRLVREYLRARSSRIDTVRSLC